MNTEILVFGICGLIAVAMFISVLAYVVGKYGRSDAIPKELAAAVIIACGIFFVYELGKMTLRDAKTIPSGPPYVLILK